MDLIKWFSGLFSKDGTLELDIGVGELVSEIYYKELAIQACVNLISNAVARSEFLTYEKGKELKVGILDPTNSKTKKVLNELEKDQDILKIFFKSCLAGIDHFTMISSLFSNLQ